eukprot:2618936-Rhodomonas_salina.5
MTQSHSTSRCVETEVRIAGRAGVCRGGKGGWLRDHCERQSRRCLCDHCFVAERALWVAQKMGDKTWSSALVEAVRGKGSDLRITLEGPYGYMGVSLEHYSTVVCVGGGIGFTPMAPLLVRDPAIDPELSSSPIFPLRAALCLAPASS